MEMHILLLDTISSSTREWAKLGTIKKRVQKELLNVLRKFCLRLQILPQGISSFCCLFVCFFTVNIFFSVCITEVPAQPDGTGQIIGLSPVTDEGGVHADCLQVYRKDVNGGGAPFTPSRQPGSLSSFQEQIHNTTWAGTETNQQIQLTSHSLAAAAAKKQCNFTK